jgi:hypothetical protein
MKSKLLSGTEKDCDLDEMACLKTHEDYISTLINPWDNGESSGISCTCMQGCEELGFRLVYTDQERE